MQLSEHNSMPPEAFRGFVEGVQKLQDYLLTNTGASLEDAEKQLTESLAFNPDFAPARYYKAIVLTHARKADAAIDLLESLNEGSSPFKAEVLYNLAFAYARKYNYELVKRSLDLLDEAYKLSHYYVILGAPFMAKRLDLAMLIQAMQAWVMCVYGGRDLKHPADFEQRRIEYLPKAEKLAKSILVDRRLKKLAPDTRTAVRVEANNAAGIAYMRMGQYSRHFEEGAALYWHLSVKHYSAALALHSQDVRVLDNLSTLNLIRARYAHIHNQLPDASAYAMSARDTEERAISLNPRDRFRWLNLARAYAMLGDWQKAETATDRILEEPGVPMEKEVETLRRAISGPDLTPILESYPIEE